MMDKFEKHDSTICNEIVERPVDFFYDNMTCIISMSLVNLPESNSADIEQWDTFLLDSWNVYFAQLDNILDFLKHCVYHTCLAGRFYKTNCFLSLDDAVYLIKDRFPDADTSLKTWHQLHKLARLILLERCKESSSGASLFLDLHSGTDGVCVDSQDNANILDLMYLPNEEERVLVFHITIRYNSYDDKSLLTSSRNSSDLNPDFNQNSILDKPGVSSASKYATSPKQSDSFFKSFSDSNDTNHWAKYGARPKSKRYLKKNSSDTTRSQKEHETDFPEKYVEKDACPNVFVEDQLRRKRLENLALSLLSEINSINETVDNYLNEAHRKYQDLSLSSTPKMPCLKNFTEKGSHLQEFDNSNYEKYGARPKDKQCSQNRSCQVLGNIKKCKPPDYFAKHVDAAKPAGHDFISPRYFEHVKGLEGVFTTEEELEKMPENMREVQKKYEEAALNLMKSEGAAEFYSNNNGRLTQSLRQEEYTSVPERDISLIMPFICFAQNTSDDKITQTMKAKEAQGFDDNTEILLSCLKTFFENSKVLDATSEDNRSSGSVMTTNPVGEYCINFRTSESELDRVPFIDTEDSDEVNIAEPTNRIRPLSFEDGNSGHFAIETFDDKMSFNWEHFSSEREDSNEVNIAEATNRIRPLSFEDGNSGHFAIETFDDKMSFNWEHFSREKPLSMENQEPVFSQEISAEKVEHYSENNKVLTVDGKQIPLETTDEAYDAFFENLVQKLTTSPTKSPQHSGSLQSTYGEQLSTPEKESKLSDLLKSFNLENPDDEIRLQNSPADELLFDLCDQSLELSDYSPESDSIEFENNGGSAS